MEALALLLVFGVVILVGRAILARRPRGRGSSGAAGSSDWGDAAFGLMGHGGGHRGDDDGSHHDGGDSGFDGGGDFGGGDAGGGVGGGDGGGGD